MERTYFTDAEARTKVGNIVEALADFPSVPKGSKGTVVRVKRYAKNKSAALIEWTSRDGHGLSGRLSWMPRSTS
jgi:hypothetical protein